MEAGVRAALSYWWINAAADNVWAGQVKLVDQLLLSTFGPSTRDADRNRVRSAAALQAKRRMLLIAPLATYPQERCDAMSRQLKIGGFHGMPIAFLQNGLWESTMRRYSGALAGWRSRNGRWPSHRSK